MVRITRSTVARSHQRGDTPPSPARTHASVDKGKNTAEDDDEVNQHKHVEDPILAALLKDPEVMDKYKRLQRDRGAGEGSQSGKAEDPLDKDPLAKNLLPPPNEPPKVIQTKAVGRQGGISTADQLQRILGDDDKSPVSVFIPEIRDFAMPPRFEFPDNLKPYAGDTDPLTFLADFTDAMILRCAPKPFMCKAFPTYLTGRAKLWFNSLPKESIDSYHTLGNIFHTRFSQRKTVMKTFGELMSIKQREGESLKAYMERFNDEQFQIPDLTDQLIVTAFMTGLASGELYGKLSQEVPRTAHELFQVVGNFIRADEANRKKREAEKGLFRREDNKRRMLPPPVLQKPSSSRMPDGRLTPLTHSRSDILHIHRDVFRPPPPETAGGRNTDAWCEYHKSQRHHTESYRELKKEIEMFIRRGELLQYIQIQPEMRGGLI